MMRYRCDVCEKDFAAKKDLRRHMKITHSPTGKIIVKCDVCERTFANYSIYKYHMRHSHLNQKTVCIQCGKKLSCPKSLERHVNFIHNRTTQFQCDICDKCFWCPESIRTHYLGVHERVTYACEFCKANIRGKSNLRSHIKRHEKDPQPITSILQKKVD